MGDDVHIRVQASTNLFLRNLLPHLVAVPHPAGWRSPASCRATTSSSSRRRWPGPGVDRWAAQVPGSSIVTTMARNGSALGIKLAGSDAWHLTDAPPIGDALYYAGQGPRRARAIGDSAVLELVGLGAPRRPDRPPWRPSSGVDERRRGDDRAAGPHLRRPQHPLQAADRLAGHTGGCGRPEGGRARITPKVTTGILHASDGSGQVGAGVATAPVECFQSSLLALDRGPS
jgi:hypothetical protein